MRILIKCVGGLCDSTSPVQVSDCLALEQVPRVLRALGFYPSERDIADIKNEVKYAEYLKTGKFVSEIDLPTFIKLYVNHRPAFGMAPDEVRHCRTVGGLDCEGATLYGRQQSASAHLECSCDHRLLFTMELTVTP